MGLNVTVGQQRVRGSTGCNFSSGIYWKGFLKGTTLWKGSRGGTLSVFSASSGKMPSMMDAVFPVI